jgi:hypothetical protein
MSILEGFIHRAFVLDVDARKLKPQIPVRAAKHKPSSDDDEPVSLTVLPPALAAVDAPGIEWGSLDGGVLVATWRASRDAINSGFKPQSMWLWQSAGPLKDVDKAFIVELCGRLQNEMNTFMRGGVEEDVP